jgi:hypothetical protein
MIEKTTWFQLQPLYQHLRQQAENKKFYKYLEIGATFLLIAIFLFTAITPTATAISKLIGEINSKQILEKKLKAKISSIIIAQDNYSLMQEMSKYQVLESSFPYRPRYYQSALGFSSSATNSNIGINQLMFNLKNEDTPIAIPDESKKIFTIDVSAQGTYQSSLGMINNILKNRRLSDIESIRLDQIKRDQQVSSGSNYINLNLSTNLFYLPTIPNEQK